MLNLEQKDDPTHEKVEYLKRLINIEDSIPCFHFLARIKELEKSEADNIITFFSNFLSQMLSQESNFLLERMIEQNLISPEFVKDRKTLYFFHYNSKGGKNTRFPDPFNRHFFSKIEELEKDDWKLHKQFVHEGINPLEITKVIRADNVEKLQELSAEPNFDFNQVIEPSLYERCSFINKKSVSILDYSAFFGSIKCFKFLLVNGARPYHTGKFAIAGGNPEIVHLCQQNFSIFRKTFETAIMFHRNDMFYYLYDEDKNKINNLSNLGMKCVEFSNYEIFSFLMSEGMEINDSIINEAARMGNLFLIKDFIEKYQIPKNIIAYCAKSYNLELIKLILGLDNIKINEVDVYLYYSNFFSVFFNIFCLYLEFIYMFRCSINYCN